MISRLIDDEVVLLPIFNSSKDANYIYTLNKSASVVWELINGKRSLKKIKEELLKEFDATDKQIDVQIAALFKDLKEIKAIK